MQSHLSERVNKIIETLDLLPHPEGGFYKEMFRSEEISTATNQSITTSIYFLLTSENVSNFHRIASDELWFFHEGSSLIVHTLGEKGHETIDLGLNLEKGERAFALVKGGTIFGSSVKDENSYSLVSCVVAPGFDFATFELFKRADLIQQFPKEVEIITRLTNE